MTDRAELERLSRTLGSIMADAMPPGVGFTLLVFDFGERGNLAYISNAVREDMLAAMREFIAKQSQ